MDVLLRMDGRRGGALNVLDIVHFYIDSRGGAWKTKVLEAKAFSAHLRRFLSQIKPLAFGGKKTNSIILKSEIKWGL
jgi:hypothetical protein